MKTKLTTFAIGLTLASTSFAAVQSATKTATKATAKASKTVVASNATTATNANAATANNTNNAALAAAATTQASNASVAPISLRKMLQKANFGMSLLNDTSTTRDLTTEKINGFASLNYVFTNYKLSANDVIKSESRFIMSRKTIGEAGADQTTETANDFDRFTLSYQRKNLLTEATHGVNLSTQIDYRLFPEVSFREKYRRDGMARARLSANKQLNERIGVSAEVLRAVYSRQTGNGEPFTGYTEIILDGSVGITQKLSVGLTFDYTHLYKSEPTTSNLEYESTDIYPALNYAFSKSVSGSLYTSFYGVLKAHDGTTVGNGWSNHNSYGASLYVTAF